MPDTRRPEVLAKVLGKTDGDEKPRVRVTIDQSVRCPLPLPLVARRRGGEPMSEFAHRMLLESIEAVAERREVALVDPERDFTRVRKVSLADLLSFLVYASEDTTGAELCDYFGWDGNAPSVSALTQLRKKLAPGAMPELLREFMSRFPVVPYLGRWRLLAVDGTGVGIARNADKRTEVTSNQYGRHRNEMHPTMVFDPVRGTFEDMVVQGSKVQDESAAFCELIDRFECGRAADGALLAGLWLADRGFTTYNTIAHLRAAGASFVLRCREDWARRMLGEDMADGDLDVTVERFLTRSESTELRSRPDEPELYRVIDRDTRLDCLPKGSKGEYYMGALRLVRVAIPAADDGDPDGDGRGEAKPAVEDKGEPNAAEAKPKAKPRPRSRGKGKVAREAHKVAREAHKVAKGNGKSAKGGGDEGAASDKDKDDAKPKGGGSRWLTLVTNLTEEDGFDAQAIVDAYKIRWSEEVGIRYLKHTCGMKDPRCRDYARAEQEIWGRLVLASACALAISGAEKPKPGPKHERAVDVTMAFKAFLRILRGREDVDLEAICGRYTHSVRRGRHFDRHKSKESRVRLCYRH